MPAPSRKRPTRQRRSDLHRFLTAASASATAAGASRRRRTRTVVLLLLLLLLLLELLPPPPLLLSVFMLAKHGSDDSDSHGIAPKLLREKEKEDEASHQTNKSDLLGGDKVSWVWSITQVGSIKKNPARLQSNEQIREH